MGKILLTVLLVSLISVASAGVDVDQQGISSCFSAVSSGPEKTLSGVPYKRGSTVEGGARRIEYVSVTVDDLELASQFYGEVLGGLEVNVCPQQSQYCTKKGAVRVYGDAVDSAMFGLDRALGVETPDISAGGKHQALMKFFVLGNGMVQIVKFVNRQSGEGYNLREPMTSPVWMAQAHMDLWVEDEVDPDDYVDDVEKRSAGYGMSNVAFNRPIPQETRADRKKCPKNKFANKVTGTSFDGLAWAYFKGVAGEQMEMYQITRTMKLGIGRAYCRRGAVSAAFINRGAKSKYESKATRERSASASLHGLFQYGYRTSDLHKAAGFYTEVLGGDLITYPTQGIQIMLDDSAHWMILANETITAYEHAESVSADRQSTMRKFGVPNISSTGTNRLDHRFILFDNFVVEPLKYTDGLTFGGDGFNPQFDHASSAAYIGTVVGAFGIEGVDTKEWISTRNDISARQGFHSAKLPPKVAKFEVDHPFSGLEFGYGKGPDGEAIAIVQIHDGSFKEALRTATVEAGAVTTLFSERNPYTNGDMSEFCAYATGTPIYGAYEL